jgi:type IV secretory pathway VirB2 component (pilin)
MPGDAGPLRLFPSAPGKTGRPRRYARAAPICTVQILASSIQPACTQSSNQNGDHVRMSNLMTTLPRAEAELFAAVIAAGLATSGKKLQVAGARLSSVATRLKARASRPAVVVPVVTAVALLLAMHPAFAAVGGQGSLDSFLQNVADMITGTTGQVIAVIAVAVCGLGAMFGALSARAFGGVVLGCAIVFSAAWIVGKITGGGTVGA